MFDEKIFWTIESYIASKGWTSGKTTHLGNNVFEIEITEYTSGWSSCGGTYTFKVEEGEVKIIDKKNMHL